MRAIFRLSAFIDGHVYRAPKVIQTITDSATDVLHFAIAFLLVPRLMHTDG